MFVSGIVITALDSEGRTLPFAQLFTYDSGTLDRAETYYDSGCTIENPWPLVADGAGRFFNINLLTGTYKQQIFDRYGSPQFIQDDILVNETGTTKYPLTIGTHLTGGSYNGSSPVTIATDATPNATASTIVSRDSGGSSSFTNSFDAATIKYNNGVYTVALTSSSSRYQILAAEAQATYILPDATTLDVGSAYEFYNGSDAEPYFMRIQLYGLDDVFVQINYGAICKVVLIDNSTAYGDWIRFNYVPASVQFDYTKLVFGGDISCGGTVQAQNIQEDTVQFNMCINSLRF